MRAATTNRLGEMLREWRSRRRLSQLDLALEAEISPKHLSFLETGRAKPSREMVLHLAEHLAIPLRERNKLLTAAGFAAVYSDRALDDEALQTARNTIDMILKAHEPNPALAIDLRWNLLAANRTAGALLHSVPAFLLEPPINVLRLSMHPEGLANNIANFGGWRSHLFERLRRQIEISADAGLIALERELRSFPVPPSAAENDPIDPAAIAIPFRLRMGEAELSFISTITVFGTPLDVTLAEIAIESFFPTDAFTAELIKNLA